MSLNLSGAHFIEVDAEVRYWEDARINGAEDKTGSAVPFRSGNSWRPVIRIADGRVMDWPSGTTADIHYKVCDAGLYWLLDENRQRIAKWDDHYVPDAFLCHGSPGYGDYIILLIDGDGQIGRWRAPQIEPAEWAPIA